MSSLNILDIKKNGTSLILCFLKPGLYTTQTSYQTNGHPAQLALTMSFILKNRTSLLRLIKTEIGDVCILAIFDPVYNNGTVSLCGALTRMKLLIYMHFAPYRSHAILLFNLYNILPLNFQYGKSVCTTSS